MVAGVAARRSYQATKASPPPVLTAFSSVSIWRTVDSGWRVYWRLCENIDDDRREKADKHYDEADDRQVDRATVILSNLTWYLECSIERDHLESHTASI
jgi:hypothetical protein